MMPRAALFLVVLAAASCSREKETAVTGRMKLVVVEPDGRSNEVPEPRLSAFWVVDAAVPRPVPPVEATPLPAGTFHLKATPGAHVLRVHLDGASVDVPVTVAAGKVMDVGTVELRIPRTTPPITQGVAGKVIWSHWEPSCPTCEGGPVIQTPLARVPVVAESAGKTFETLTAYDGSYSLALDAGDWQLAAHQQTAQVRVIAGSVSTHDFRCCD